MSFSNFFDDVQFDYEKNKKDFIDNLNFLKNQDVYESTFYKKYEEINSNNFKKYIQKSSTYKSKLWSPRDINNKKSTIEDIENLKPNIRLVENKSDDEMWTILRICCHTMSYESTPGRFLKFLIYDENTEKILGVTSISSDVISITDRDNYIGWSQENKLSDKKLVNSAIGSCIMATQPFGYNFLGGKLVACLITSEYVRDIWKKLYNNVLVGMTTTSLYGSCSMYNNIPYWHKCGSSAGKILLKPDDKYYEIWHSYIKKNRADEYNKKMTQKEGVSGPVTGAKLRILNMIFNELGIKSSEYNHGFERGVYYSCIYENTKDFLQNKISEKDLIIKSKYKNDISGMIDWWKPKAINRYNKLYNDNNLKPDFLYYNDLLNYSYKDAKTKYMIDVGR
jgi:hypothetical protein